MTIPDPTSHDRRVGRAGGLVTALVLVVFTGCSDDGSDGPVGPSTADPPPAVEELRVVPDGQQLHVSWEHPPSFSSGYQLEFVDVEPSVEDDWAGATRVDREDLGRATEYRIEDLEPDTSYFVSVFAVDHEGVRSARSVTVSARTGPMMVATVDADGQYPSAIEVNGEGQIYGALDWRILRAESADFAPIYLELPSGVGADDVAIGPDDRIFAVGRAENSVAMMSPDGVTELVWGEYGDGAGRFRDPIAIAVDDSGRVFVADRRLDRVQVFDRDGTWLRMWRLLDPDGAVYQPIDLAIGRQGTVYALVRSPFPDRVLVYTAHGEFVRSWGAPDATQDARTQVVGPRSLAVQTANGTDRVHVACAYGTAWDVRVFEEDGAFVTRWKVDSRISTGFTPRIAVGVGPDGEVLVNSHQNQQIQVYGGNP